MASTAISLVWEDAEGKRYPTTINFDYTDVDTLAKAATQLSEYEPILEAMSGCVITEASVTFPLTADDVATPDVGYSVRAGAYLSFVDSDGVGQGIYIPGMLASKMANDVVNDGDSDVAAFIADALGEGVGGEEPLSARGSGALFTTFRGGKGASRKVK